MVPWRSGSADTVDDLLQLLVGNVVLKHEPGTEIGNDVGGRVNDISSRSHVEKKVFQEISDFGRDLLRPEDVAERTPIALPRNKVGPKNALVGRLESPGPVGIDAPLERSEGLPISIELTGLQGRSPPIEKWFFLGLNSTRLDSANRKSDGRWKRSNDGHREEDSSFRVSRNRVNCRFGAGNSMPEEA